MNTEEGQIYLVPDLPDRYLPKLFQKISDQ